MVKRTVIEVIPKRMRCASGKRNRKIQPDDFENGGAGENYLMTWPKFENTDQNVGVEVMNRETSDVFGFDCRATSKISFKIR